MKRLRTLDQIEESYLLKHPREVDAYLEAAFASYGEDGDSAALLASLRVLARVKGISALARKTRLTRQGVQKALSARGNPRLDSINAIMHAMGYRLAPERLDIR
jgi:probable addiction module antidote protein